jgi:hypothetical protein
MKRKKKRKKKGKNTRSDDSLVKITPLAYSKSALAKVLGGVEVITNGVFAIATILANTFAHEFFFQRV